MAKSGKDAQASFRLPQALYDRLRAAAGDRPIGDEMRRRLEQSLEVDAGDVDLKTRQLLASIGEVAEVLYAFHGPWYEEPWSLAVLRRAIDTLLSAVGPKGEPVFQKSDKTIADTIWETTDVQAVGHTLGVAKAAEFLKRTRT